MKILNNIFNSLIVPITMFAYGDLTKVNIEKAKGHKKLCSKSCVVNLVNNGATNSLTKYFLLYGLDNTCFCG